MHDFRKLNVWNNAIVLVEEIYKLTQEFPDAEKYGLIAQIRRSAISIPSNIAEGAGRKTPKDFSYFLSVSTGSSFELETQLILAEKLEFAEPKDINSIISKIHSIQKQLYALNKSLKI